jgi:hypothetical protein
MNDDPLEQTDQPQPQDSGDEPSVLDWVMSLLSGKPIAIPDHDVPAPVVEGAPPRRERRLVTRLDLAPPLEWNWSLARLPVALILAMFAQLGLEGKTESAWVSIGLYLAAAVLVGWAVWDWRSAIHPPEDATIALRALRFRPLPLAGAFVFSVLTFLTSGENQFTIVNVTFWTAGVLLIVAALWEGEAPFRRWFAYVRTWLGQPKINISIGAWGLAVLIVWLVSIFFRVYQLNDIPAEMVSDHAEKLLDVVDVLEGRYAIFFGRNTGREALQFYMAAATVQLFDTGISHLTLKIGTVFAGILTLPYIYLLGKELANREVGLFALILAGIGYWPNVISRVGLRFPLFPLFVAPAMYYLLRGLRTRQRNDLLICGLVVGVGLHGYSPARVIPILITIGVILYLLHHQARGRRWAAFTWLVAAGVVALVVLMPLLRVSIDLPDAVLFRTLTRVGGSERPIEGSAWAIFFGNVWDALRMFGWDNGEVWVNSIPHRPALDWVTAALFHLGIVIFLVRYIRDRRWSDLFVLLSIPVLQLPSTLSIAFPGENPATNRAAGAFVPAFLAAGLALGYLYTWVRAIWRGPRRAKFSALLVVFLLAVAARENYRLVFEEYGDLYRRSAWNTSQAGEIIQHFAESIGAYETAHMVAYPHWMDTRLVGMHAGQPKWDYAIWADEFETIQAEPRSMLFILNPQDTASLEELRRLFPDGVQSTRASELEGKDLIQYFVPPDPTRGAGGEGSTGF